MHPSIDSPQITDAIEVFISYSQEDENLLNELDKHLSSLRRSHLIRTWNDSKVEAGTDRIQETAKRLKSADVILLMVSANFLASDHRYMVELKQAVHRHEAGEARVIPIILRPVDWYDTPFSALKPLPKDGDPVTLWKNQDEAFLDIAKGIRSVVEKLIEERHQKRLQQYNEIFLQAANHEYPLSATTEQWLVHKQRELQLEEAEVQRLETPIRARKEAEYQAYRQKCDQYRQIFQQMMEQEFPITAATWTLLNQKQMELGLRDEDIKRIERPLQEQKQREYDRNFQQYWHAFKAEYQLHKSLNPEQREKLMQLKTRLKLSDLDAARIESELTSNVPVLVFLSELKTNHKLSLLLGGSLLSILVVTTIVHSIGSHNDSNPVPVQSDNSVVNPPRSSPFLSKSPTPTPTILKVPIIRIPSSLTADTSSLPQQQAVDLVSEWLNIKPQVFGPNYNLQLARNFISEPMYWQVEKGVRDLQKRNAHLRFGNSQVVFEGYFCNIGQKAEIHLKTIQRYVEYENGIQQRIEFSPINQAAYGIQYLEGSWKLVDSGRSTEREELDEFRARFWQMNPAIVDRQCPQN
jgi:hypothetical protein